MALLTLGWAEMRVMTALNTVAPGLDGDYVFGKVPELGTAFTSRST